MRLKYFAECEQSRLFHLMNRYEKLANDLQGVKLHIKQYKGNTRYYISTNENTERRYIGWRTQPELLQRLLARKNARDKLQLIKANYDAVTLFLKSWQPMMASNTLDIPLRGRKAFPLSQNPYKKEELIHDTGLGFFTRSKSEAIVARRLFEHGLYFEYEAPLQIMGLFGWRKNIYPDFTIYLDDGKVIYLEHVGLLDQEKYQKKFLRKVLEYHKNDYLISRDVYITMDGPAGDIDIAAIDALIRTF